MTSDPYIVMMVKRPFMVYVKINKPKGLEVAKEDQIAQMPYG